MIDATSLSDPPAPWGRYELADGEPKAVRIGPRDLWLRWRNGEIWLALGPERPGPAAPGKQGGDGPRTSPPEGSGWSRWATARGESEVLLRPIFPDRALVLEPERPFRLLPRATARVYVRVPLWLRVELPVERARDEVVVLEEVALTSLSDTWWGGLSQGELAYWLPITARRDMKPELWTSHLAVCPLVMTNRASEDLRVEKLAFRVAHLTLFEEGGRFWADESSVTYHGEGEGTQVEMTGSPPEEARGARRVSEPRAPASRGMRARTFGRLTTIPLLGGVE
jgi:hypothetical protein